GVAAALRDVVPESFGSALGHTVGDDAACSRILACSPLHIAVDRGEAVPQPRCAGWTMAPSEIEKLRAVAVVMANDLSVTNGHLERLEVPRAIERGVEMLPIATLL